MAECENEQESQKVMEQYARMIDMKPTWVNQIENLLVSIEMYRIEEEKAINRLAEVLTAYGVDVTEEQVRRADAEEIKEKVNESRNEQEAEDEEREDDVKSEQYTPKCTLKNPVL
jgi:transcriptional regulator with XRE-family HTH domain